MHFSQSMIFKSFFTLQSHHWISLKNTDCKNETLADEEQIVPFQNIFQKYSRLSISRTRISRILQTRSVHLNQKYILIAFFYHNVALDTFLQVQIIWSANKFALRLIWTCKKLSPQLRDIESWLYWNFTDNSFNTIDQLKVYWWIFQVKVILQSQIYRSNHQLNILS